MRLTSKKLLRFFLAIGAAYAVALITAGCGGKQSLASPGVYSGPQATSPVDNSTYASNDSAASSKTVDSSKPLIELLLNDKDSSHTTIAADTADSSMDDADDQDASSLDGIADTYYSSADSDDSASAVDDDIWRQFDLAEEYQAMGVIANREASWEEAQYYFEKALKILANLDVEGDSTLTPEATKYNSLLDNIVADYQVTLRSLGNVSDDVSSSVLIERFADLASRLKNDSMVVYKDEGTAVTYDIPIVMNDRVKSSIIYFQTVARDAFYKYLRRSRKYAPMMRRVLTRYGLPQDLVYLSLVESGYNPHAYSWARAMGLWQFMSSTGRLYGLHRSWWVDERKDPEKSTEAACKFLKDLYNEFGSWELAMAAYNGGPGRVRSTIKKQRTDDFWKMRLKRQTMDYVPLIMAATIIAKNPEKYGFYDVEYEDEVEYDEVTIDRCLELSVVADDLGCTVQELKDLNPELLRKYTPPNAGKYTLHVPKGTKTKFLAAYDDMPSPKETSWVRHRIRRGETVSTIAARYGVSQYAIIEANNLKRSARIIAGKELIVPVPLDHEYGRSPRPKNQNYTTRNSMYVVRAGDTMWDIARAFGTTVDALRGMNYIERGSRIYVGQKLKIPGSARDLPRMESPLSNSEGSYASTQDNTKSYKVRSGDTLWDIARKFGTTTANIRRLNSLGRSSRIYPGQELVVTGHGGGAKYVIHKVRRGETLGSIARKYRTTVSRIRVSNDIDDPDMLMIGDNLKIYLN
jgi:membrane-bound lytic murein transglycosylase D